MEGEDPVQVGLDPLEKLMFSKALPLS